MRWKEIGKDSNHVRAFSFPVRLHRGRGVFMDSQDGG